MRKLRHIDIAIIFICIFVLLLSACSSTSQQLPIETGTFTSSPTSTSIAPTVIPNKTSTTIPTSIPTIGTPVPTLMSHEWIPIDPLIAFGGTGGDGGDRFDFTLPFQFTLQSDGELFILDWNKDTYNYEIKSTKISRQETCLLLNSIDQAGFFDYDISSYIDDPANWIPPVMGAGRTHITVQSWDSNSVELYGLGVFINNEDKIKESWGCGECTELQFPTILPSIRSTYLLLSKYEVSNLEIYQSDRIGLWVEPYDKSTFTFDWPVEEIKLSQIVAPEGVVRKTPNLVLTGEEAKEVYRFFNQTIETSGMYVMDGDKIYLVFARPLLPSEFLSETGEPSDVVRCSPDDGWVEIP